MPGKLLEYITDFPRVVGGVDEESTRRAVDLYRHIVKAEITPTDVLTAEMSKVVENAYRDVNIAFANEVALACERMGVNVFEVRELINARPDRHMHSAARCCGPRSTRSTRTSTASPTTSWLTSWTPSRSSSARPRRSTAIIGRSGWCWRNMRKLNCRRILARRREHDSV